MHFISSLYMHKIQEWSIPYLRCGISLTSIMANYVWFFIFIIFRSEIVPTILSQNCYEYVLQLLLRFDCGLGKMKD